jgi:hypothetical protein
VNSTTVLLSVLIVVACALCGVAIWALIEAVKTARSVRVLSDDLDARVVPLLDKVDVSVDAFNAELLRVDAIVTRFEEISDRVDEASRTVQEVANAPVEIVTDFADRVRRAWRTRKSQRPEESEPAAEPGLAETLEPPIAEELDPDPDPGPDPDLDLDRDPDLPDA